MTIRPYGPADRAAVRRIAIATADRGEPLGDLLPDAELAADLLTAYHTDFEPECLWMAEADGEPVGYLTGCLRPGYRRTCLLLRVVPAAIWRALWRGVFGTSRWWRFLALQLRLPWPRAGRQTAASACHLHLNLLSAYRGRGAGAALLACFEQQARARGATVLRLSTRADNAGAHRFFEQHGFVALDEYPILCSSRAAAGYISCRIYEKVLRHPDAGPVGGGHVAPGGGSGPGGRSGAAAGRPPAGAGPASG